jgi:hypothetical protein
MSVLQLISAPKLLYNQGENVRTEGEGRTYFPGTGTTFHVTFTQNVVLFHFQTQAKII